MAGVYSAKLKLGTRKNVKTLIEKLVGLATKEYAKDTGKSVPPKMTEFLTALLWAWVDFFDEAVVRKGKISVKDAGIFAVKKALLAVGLVESEYAECATAAAAFTVSLYENYEGIAASSEAAVATVELPFVSAAFALVALGAAVSVAYDFVEMKNKCEPAIIKTFGTQVNHPAKMDWFAAEHERQNACYM